MPKSSFPENGIKRTFDRDPEMRKDMGGNHGLLPRGIETWSGEVRAAFHALLFCCEHLFSPFSDRILRSGAARNAVRPALPESTGKGVPPAWVFERTGYAYQK